ncbi:hypothetical protein StoSoilA2_13860 [Arthrobacter sp. StoSoilA2]|nr:hypothetical protein StoSoilA2_13860 [Arthrobacter sp. StoSoilA2]
MLPGTRLDPHWYGHNSLGDGWEGKRSALTRTKVKGIFDTQCGFKFFERDALTAAMVQCRASGFAFDVELLLRLQHQNARIIELPVAWTDGAESTFRPMHDGIASFASVLQLQKTMP